VQRYSISISCFCDLQKGVERSLLELWRVWGIQHYQHTMAKWCHETIVVWLTNAAWCISRPLAVFHAGTNTVPKTEHIAFVTFIGSFTAICTFLEGHSAIVGAVECTANNLFQQKEKFSYLQVHLYKVKISHIEYAAVLQTLTITAGRSLAPYTNGLALARTDAYHCIAGVTTVGGYWVHQVWISCCYSSIKGGHQPWASYSWMKEGGNMCMDIL